MKSEKKRGHNRFIIMGFGCYLMILIFICFVTCYFAYERNQEEVKSQINMTLLQVANEYEDMTDHFWTLYMPIFEKDQDNFMTLHNYFQEKQNEKLEPLEKYEIAKILSKMSIQDSRVQWVAAISTDRKFNYIFYTSENTLQILENDFPYWEQIQKKTKQMEIYGDIGQGRSYSGDAALAVAGGVPSAMGNGTIVVGYSVSKLQQICKRQSTNDKICFAITENNQSLFSTGDFPVEIQQYPLPGKDKKIVTSTGTYYLYTFKDKVNGAAITYYMNWNSLVRQFHKDTPMILMIVMLLSITSIILYYMLLHLIDREVNMIQNGLDKIGQKQLNSRITGHFYQNSFKEIADSINQMTQSLKENIDRAYYYEVKQRESELQELQSKFNPHFLYNSLEIFRARCYQNGDEDTAELIAQTASIFRGFIGSKTFIPMQEELAFSKRYLALFRARFDDEVRVLYDIAPEVLEYGVIRNIFQPLIENYFEHGYETAYDDNYILFRAKIGEKGKIIFEVVDNGQGISKEKEQELQKSFQEPMATEQESYGLKNLHQRIRLFYGEEYGLTIHANLDRGITIRFLLKCMTCEEMDS